MIKATELRIGNLVDYLGEPIIVDGIDDIDVFNKSIGEIPLHCIGGIQLTEEMLVKLGVKTKADTCGELYVKDGWLCQNYSEGDGGTHYIAEVKYVHTLQNAIHAISGEELTMKQ